MLFIADEVICGFGRTGNVWGCQTMNIKPDILTCAKALSASFLPISAVMINEKVYQALMSESDKIGTWGHGFTYSGHPVAAAVALEAQKIYDEIDLFGHAKRMSPIFQKHLQSFADHPLVGEAMGVGMVGALEIVADKKTKTRVRPRHGRRRHARLQPRRGARPVHPQHGRPRRDLPAADHQRDRARRPVRPPAPVVRRRRWPTSRRKATSRADVAGSPLNRDVPPLDAAARHQPADPQPGDLGGGVFHRLGAAGLRRPGRRRRRGAKGQRRHAARPRLLGARRCCSRCGPPSRRCATGTACRPTRWLGALPLLSVSLFLIDRV